MRFLTGMLIGSVLTFGIATAIGLPTHEIVGGLKARVAAVGFSHSPVVPVVLPDVLDSMPPREARLQVEVGQQPEFAPMNPVDLNAAGTGSLVTSNQTESLPEVIEPRRVALSMEPESVAIDPVPVELQTEIVWVPFRSERSAMGFADHMSDSLDHPFSVQREGAGRYHVAFQYTSSDEREVLLTGVRQLTGEHQ